MSKYVMYAAVAVVALCNAAFSCSDGKPYVRPGMIRRCCAGFPGS